jgi:hypothetical protein
MWFKAIQLKLHQLHWNILQMLLLKYFKIEWKSHAFSECTAEWEYSSDRQWLQLSNVL